MATLGKKIPQIINPDSFVDNVMSSYNMYVIEGLNQVESIESKLSGFSFVTQFAKKLLFGNNANVFQNAVFGMKAFPFVINCAQNGQVLDTRQVTIGTVDLFVNPTTRMELPYPEKTYDSSIKYTITVPEDAGEAGFISNPEKRQGKNCFLNYEPYTTYSLYVPFIGFVPLEAKLILGKTLTLQYFTDLYTGKATAVIYIEEQPPHEDESVTLFSGECQLGVDIPWGTDTTGFQMVDYIGESVKTIAKSFAGMGGLSKKLASVDKSESAALAASSNQFFKDKVNAIGTAEENLKNWKANWVPGHGDDYERQNIDLNYNMAIWRANKDKAARDKEITEKASIERNNIRGEGVPQGEMNNIFNHLPGGSSISYTSGSGLQLFTTPLAPYLRICKTNVINPESLDFGYYFGYPVAKKITVGQHWGFCQMSSIKRNFNVNISDDEFALIDKYLQSGVYIQDEDELEPEPTPQT